ncbi:hypothetical protein Cob_v003914 [Colletotrichum orbiculare MAFF 240422]|uniref:Uncharacterized protein n=1 Tax=Colletotrichum orbiculare (strain 104-T / ATCC 96160 / CBS 514.97 / LARS 414 / MAFF 240422) TaxID=1213857 RepID=N4W3P9_COLOR|nr:hypothetical protein Cob_v003914 [Colletotrichum orbiculare MAFF 240422]
MEAESTDSAESNNECLADGDLESFPNFDDSHPGFTIDPQVEKSTSDISTEAPRKSSPVPTEADIQAAIKRANQAFTNPLTNVPRRGSAQAGRTRNRSSELSFSFPSSHNQEQTESLIRSPPSCRGRPVVVGGYDNPYEEHLQRVARRDQERKRRLEEYMQSRGRPTVYQPRPLPEPPIRSSPAPLVSLTSKGADSQSPAPADPLHPLRSNPVTSNHEGSTAALPRRRPRSSSVSVPPDASPVAFPEKQHGPSLATQQLPAEEDDFEYSEEPQIQTAQVGRVFRRSDSSSEVQAPALPIVSDNLRVEDFAEEFDLGYYESDDLEAHLADLPDEFNPNAAEDADSFPL